MEGQKTGRMKTERGFTLIEVTMAILVLSSALVVLLGMQSSLLGLSVSDRQRQGAMLLARRILSSIEISEEQAAGEKSGDGAQMLSEYIDTKDMDRTDLEQLRNYSVYVVSTPVGIPALAEDALYRISVTVAWGDSPSDRMEVLYFIPNAASVDKGAEEESEEIGG